MFHSSPALDDREHFLCVPFRISCDRVIAVVITITVRQLQIELYTVRETVSLTIRRKMPIVADVIRLITSISFDLLRRIILLD